MNMLTPSPRPVFRWLACAGLLLAGLLLAGLAVPTRAADPAPNLVLIIADDLSPEDCAAYGNKGVRTPSLDRLAREGRRFDRAFVTTSSCSPSRASLLTGRYPHQTGAPQLHQPLPAAQIGFTEHLRAAGYWTAAVGKWHLGAPALPKFDVVKQGGGPSGCEQWAPTLRARPKDKPFFLWLAAIDPHRAYQPATIPEPHRPEAVTVPPYLPDTPEVRRDLALYYDEITRLDGFVGQVLAELEAQGVAENTLVLFMSDNGRPFPRCKTTLYDSGIRTPFIVRWAGRVKAGTASASLVSTVDIAPTFLALAGAKPLPGAEGKDFTPLLRDPTASVREHIIAERHWHDYDDHARAVRTQRWKYIRNSYTDIPNQPPADAVNSPSFQAMRRLRDEGELTPEQSAPFIAPRPAEELYDTQADPHELCNLAAAPEHRAVLQELRAELEAFARRTADAAPPQRRPDEFDRETGKKR